MSTEGKFSKFTKAFGHLNLESREKIKQASLGSSRQPNLMEIFMF